jgi:NitT/TauT family transport system substrate-binding protein
MNSISGEEVTVTRRAEGLSRRALLTGLSVAATANVLGLHPEGAAAEPSPETTTVKLLQFTSACQGPIHAAEELLLAEGFTSVQYVKTGLPTLYKSLASGEIHFALYFAADLVTRIESGDPIVALAGLHVGCFQLFGGASVRTIRDLKGKTVSTPGPASTPQIYIASMAAYVGVDPRKDINWVVHAPVEAVPLLAAGKIDALMGFPPLSQELRAKNIGRVVVNSTVDRPWSQYFCCMVVGNREFVQRHPVATKRTVRAILKANAICSSEPDRVARLLVDKGVATSYDYTLQTIKELPYARWREYDPEDTLRFYALRLHEAGMIGSSPQKIIAQGTDWRFFKELRRELKA